MMPTVTCETPASATEGRLAWTAPTVDVQPAADAENSTGPSSDFGSAS